MTMYRTGSGTMAAEHGTSRHGSYPGYLNPQHSAAAQHDASPHSQHIGHGNDGLSAVMNQFSSLSLPGGPGLSPGSNLAQVQGHHAYCPPQEPPVAYSSYHVPLVGMSPEAPYPFSLSGQFPVQGGYAPMPVPYSVPYTPGRVSMFTDRYQERYNERSSSSDVPALENRRGSYSTTESTPATPFFGSASDRGANSRVPVMASSYTTPSPEQIVVPASTPKPQIVDEELLALLKEHPAIPEAVPAVFTPPTHMKTIEQCLENRIHGNRNVYIRGLHPTTDDELLLHYASRFGKVEQSKAIIDTATGACKGFGFAKFAHVADSEKCIRGFYQLGYEVGFARESFNARLKAEGDESSTNLYLSNLPKNLNEAELNAIFVNYRVVSSKILRDSMGNSRGVGFARFETREECEDIIKKYHGACIGEEGLMMQQVRYADTPAQKELKRVTAERRQFRTNEYNIGAYGTADVGIHPSIYHQGSWNRRIGSGSSASFAPRTFGRSSIEGGSLSGVSPGTGGYVSKQSVATPGTVRSEDGSADEGVTIVKSPTVANGSTQSSPTIKKEKP
ncbi:hypothetical protein B0T16DRAFT_331142 [Cercophora newfieldiana]|uniref:RRM domain-containing protein n=1 Tax=Cercophora newfieldiana TaxID=92897 RepID=A0AA39Y0H5_9PEZI|nr:hypothetical protein B0T16DRAFT_331142 [Cercophora newfieldiana]